ncbi:MAG: hypothetical protein Q8K98_10495 [Bacteroidota bacterium]|nr:hypothetical protein [Bacteroidota bacterium]
MKHIIALSIIGLLLSVSVQVKSIAQQAPFTEGTVWEITYVRVKPGMGDDYLRSLSKTWKASNEEAKKQGLILSYKILSGDAANRDDWNLMLMTEHKNMASLDGFDEKFREISTKIIGTEDQQKNVMIKRIDMREILGGKQVREIILK